MSKVPRRSNSQAGSQGSPAANNHQGRPNNDMSALLGNNGQASAPNPNRGPIDPRYLQRMALQNHAVASHMAAQQQAHRHQRQSHHQGHRGQHGQHGQHGGPLPQQPRPPQQPPIGSPPPHSPRHQHQHPIPQQHQQHQQQHNQQQQQQQQQQRLAMLVGGSDALRTLALMKSLGVSSGATALAAAVLPNTALPKTAAAVTAAAAAAVNRRPSVGAAASYRHQQKGGIVPNPLDNAVGRSRSVSAAPLPAGQSNASSTSNNQKHPKQAFVNERNNTSNMLRTYGEENPLFYERLVQLVGKKDADEMVREAVDETIKEEVEGSGGNEVEPRRETDIISIADTSEEEDDDEKKKQPAPVHKKQSAQAQVHKPPLPAGGTKSTTMKAEATTQPPVPQVAIPKVVAIPPNATPAQGAAHFSPVRKTSAITAEDPKKRKADGPIPMPPTKKAVAGSTAGPRKHSHALPIPSLGPKDDELLRSLFGRPQKKNASANAVLMPGLDGTTTAAAGATTRPVANKEEEPPGFNQFKADPKFCVLLFECAKKRKKLMSTTNTKNIGGLFVHGLLSVKDEELLNSLDESDPSIRAYVKHVIAPYLNVPANLTESEGHWEAYVHISSENINEFAKSIVYQRRRAMKSAVRFAVYEIGKNRPELLNAARAQLNSIRSGPEPTVEQKKKETEKEAKIETEKDKRIKELEQQLASEKEKHSKEIKALEDKHASETKDADLEYTDFVAKLLKKHRKEMNGVKRDMKDMQNVHKTFLESYVEASMDVLRNDSESPQL